MRLRIGALLTGVQSCAPPLEYGGARADACERRRALGPPRLAQAKEQESEQTAAPRLDPGLRAQKAAHDPLASRRKRTKTRRPFDGIGQDQMDMAPAFGHAAMLRPE